MERFQGLLGIVCILGLAVALSRHRRAIQWRTLAVGLALQVVFALLVLKWGPGATALKWVADGVTKLIGFTDKGTAFVFGPLLPEAGKGFVFALNVLPVIVFLGAIISALYYLRVIQYIVQFVGTALQKVLGTSKVEGIWASTVIFLGQSEAPLMIAPYIRTLTTAELFLCMTGGFASVAGSTLVGYSLLGAPLEYLLAASIMNAPGSILLAKAFFPETETPSHDADVTAVRDTESRNLIDAIGHGAMNGGKIAVIVACLLVAFVSLIALGSAILGGIGGLFGHPEWTLEGLFGLIFAPVAWLVGTPWNEAAQVGNFIGQKTVLNEFVGFTAFSQHVGTLSPKAIMISTFALAGFANLSSIAIQIGAFGGLCPERRGDVAKLGVLALVAGTCTNLLNAAIVGVVAG